MKTADINMLIIIHMQSKRKSYIVQNCDFFIGNYGFMFSEKYHCFIYVSFGVYSMTRCDQSGDKAVYNYKNKDSVITRCGQNVTSTSTPSGSLTS